MQVHKHLLYKFICKSKKDSSFYGPYKTCSRTMSKVILHPQNQVKILTSRKTKENKQDPKREKERAFLK